ncbi:MAG: ribonuclease P protein component [Leptospirales bacterium]
MKQREFFASLKDKKHIDLVFKKGLKLYSKNLLARYIEVPSNRFFPLGVLWAVPKKTRTAVERNRLKRVMRSAMFLAAGNMDNLERSTSFYLAIIPRIEFEKLPEKERVAEMKFILADLMKNG